MRSYLLIISLLNCSMAFSQSDSLRVYYQWSMDAYKAAKFEDYLKFTERANEIRPNHPVLAYNLASAYALNEQSEKAVAALKKYLMMNATLDYVEDSDFDAIRDYPPFTALRDYVSGKNATVTKSTVAFSLSQKNDHFESITYDPMSNTFYLGTVNTRKIVTYKNGVSDTFMTLPKLYSVMGMDVDEQSNLLWVCSATLPQMNGYHDSLKNQSSIMAINLKTREILAEYLVKDALLGDIIVDSKGQAYTTDGLANRIFKADLNDFTQVADFSDQVFNLQGIAFQGHSLILSDYITGLYEYHPKSKKLTAFPESERYANKGIDGLLSYKDQVICFQNGTTPKRTFMLSDLVGVHLIDQIPTQPGEPTQGLILNNTVYYISNSAWNAYSKENEYQSDLAQDLEVRQWIINSLKD